MKFKYYIVYLDDCTTYGTNSEEVVRDCRGVDCYVVIDTEANTVLSVEDSELIQDIEQ